MWGGGGVEGGSRLFFSWGTSFLSGYWAPHGGGIGFDEGFLKNVIG